MNKTIFLVTISAFILNFAMASNKIQYPKTAKDNVVDNYFGTTVAEPYRWLENDTSKATEIWVKSQNKITYDYLDKIPFRKDLKNYLSELTNYPRYLAPFKKNGKYYFYKNNGLQNQNVLYCMNSLDAEPEVILDPNLLSKDGTVALSKISFSNNGKYMAYSIARSGSDWNEIYVIDLSTKQTLSDQIKWSKFSEISWRGNGFYYSAYEAPATGKELSVKNEFQKIYYHKIGDPQSKDEIIFENKVHPLRNCSTTVSDDERYLFITEIESTSGNSLYVKDLTKTDQNLIILEAGFDYDYSIIGNNDSQIYVLTNWHAPKQQLLLVDLKNPERNNWKVIIPESKNVLESVNFAGEKIVASYLQDATSHAYIFSISGEKLTEIQLPTIGTLSDIAGSKNDNEVFYTFATFMFPPTIYRYSIAEDKSVIFKSPEIKFDSKNYITEQIFYTSKDGTRVPMFITYKKGIIKDGNNPLMLYGYGGFNISLKPGFNVGRIPFIEQGGIYAVANIRGGGEYGEEWHKAGTKMNKQNVFDDFIAAAEYLIKQKYTCTNKLAIDGGSNGGLLIGACMTQRPDLFAVAIPEVGVLDMLRYQKFTIGWAWATDYGTSDESIDMFKYLKAYSPLHNVKKGIKYPETLVMTGDHDDRVVPAHSFKFAATLQEANSGNFTSLIRIDINAGHGAGKPVGKIIDAQTDMWSFVMYNLGMHPKF